MAYGFIKQRQLRGRGAAMAFVVFAGVAGIGLSVAAGMNDALHAIPAAVDDQCDLSAGN